MSVEHADLEGIAILVSLIHSGSFTLYSPSFTGFPEPTEEGFKGYISYRAESSKVSHSLHSVWL